MKSSDTFKNTIQAHLNNVASNDPLFALTLQKEGKTIDNCITYILNQVQNSGCNGFADEEIFGMAIHYYDEDKIEIGKPINGKVVVNHHVEISEEEKAEIRQKAKDELYAEERRKLTQKKATTTIAPTKTADTDLFAQASLFDNYGN